MDVLMAVSWQARAGQWGVMWQPLEWLTGVEEEREVHWQGRSCHSLTHLCLHEKRTNWFTPWALYIDEVCAEKVLPLVCSKLTIDNKNKQKTTLQSVPGLDWQIIILSSFHFSFSSRFSYLLFKSVQHWHLVLSTTDAVKPMTTHH